jgi:hypothetical protein
MIGHSSHSTPPGQLLVTDAVISPLQCPAPVGNDVETETHAESLLQIGSEAHFGPEPAFE